MSKGANHILKDEIAEKFIQQRDRYVSRGITTSDANLLAASDYFNGEENVSNSL